MKKLVTFNTKSTLGKIIIAMDALRLDEALADKGKKYLNYIHFNAKSMTLEVCEGHVAMKHYLSEEKDKDFIDQFGGLDGYCVLRGKDALMVEDFSEEEKKPSYPIIDRIIPDVVGRNFDSIRIIDSSLFTKRYAALLIWHIASMESDLMMNPKFFDIVGKDVLDLMPIIWFPHIETAEEEEERLAKEATMSKEDVLKSRQKLVDDARRPIMLESDDKTLRYVVMPFASAGVYRRNDD